MVKMNNLNLKKVIMLDQGLFQQIKLLQDQQDLYLDHPESENV